MSLMETLGTFVGGGGLAGALGAVTSAFVKLREKKLDYEHEREMTPHAEAKWAHEASLIRANVEHEKHLADADLLIETERLAGEGMGRVIDADAATTVTALQMDGQPWWVGAIRTLFRPGLTMILWLAVFALWAMTTDPATHTLLASTVAQAAMGTMGVWFGARIVSNGPQG